MADEKKPPGVFRRIIRWFKRQAEWWMENLADDDITAEIRADLGLNPDTPLPKTELAKLPNFAKDLDPEKESLAEVAAEIGDCASVLTALAGAAKNDQLSAWDTMFFLGTFAANESMRLDAPLAYAFGQLAMILRDDPEELGRLDPAAMVSLMRGDGPPPGGAERFHQRFFATIPVLIELLPPLLGKAGIHLDQAGIDVEPYYGWDPAPDSPTPAADLVSARALTLLLSVPSAPSVKLAVTIISVPKTTGGPGIFLSFGGSLTADTLLDGTRYRITTGGSGAFDLFIPLGDGARALEAGGDPEAFVRIEALRADPAVPAFRLGEADRSRLDVGAIKVGLEMSGAGGGMSFDLQDVALIVKMSEGDGFLKNISKKELAIRFSFGVVFDSEAGLRLAGGSKAAVTIPAATTLLDIFTVHHLDVRLGAGKQPDDFALEISAALSLALGPFRASIDRIGFEIQGGFREGNLEIMDIDPGFRAPNGIGLVLDAKWAKGGGYLFVDRERGEYAGILEIKLGPVNVKAIGILQTSSGERDDWSLLIFLFGQFPPVWVAPAINWSGVGGMIGIRRSVDVDKLQAGVRIGALDDILFPKDPVADAPRLINEFRSIFPYSPGALTVGPFVELGILNPQVVIVRAGVILQFDTVVPGDSNQDITRVIILGQVRAQFPPRIDKPVVKLICDIFGVIDLQAKRVLFSARLRDSKVAGLTLTGMIVVRKDYGEEELFILSAGGFHPDFKDIPPGFPAPIDRLGVQAIKIKGFKLEVSGYFAITPNSKQAGLAGTVKGSIGPASVEASLSFDALFLDRPYSHFLVTIKFVARVKYKGRTLAGIKVDAVLEGPGYWRFRGKFVIEILWWEIPIPFDFDTGEKPLFHPEGLNLGEVVQAALESPDAWQPQLPPGGEQFVTIAAASRAGDTFAHPSAGLNVVQNVAPLGVTLERFGNAQLIGANRFDIVSLRVGPVTVTTPDTISQPFGRGEFFDLTEEQRLTLPSFEPFTAGVKASSPDFTFGPAVSAELKYETAYLEMEPDAPRGRIFYATLFATDLPLASMEWQSRGGAAARSIMRERAAAPAGVAFGVTLVAPPLVAVAGDTLVPSSEVVLTGLAAASPTTAAQAVAGTGGAVRVLEAFELESI